MEGGSAVLESIKSPFISKTDFLEVKVPAVETQEAKCKCQGRNCPSQKSERWPWKTEFDGLKLVKLSCDQVKNNKNNIIVAECGGRIVLCCPPRFSSVSSWLCHEGRKDSDISQENKLEVHSRQCKRVTKLMYVSQYSVVVSI